MDRTDNRGRDSLFTVIGLLNRRKWIVLGVFLAGSVAVFLYAWIGALLPAERSYYPDYFEARANVVVNEVSAGLLPRMATSASFLDEIGGGRGLSRRALRQNLTLGMERGSYLVTVGYRSTTREQAAEVANAVVDLLEEQFRRIGIQSGDAQLQVIARRLREVAAERVRLQEQIDSLNRRYATLDVAASVQERADRLSAQRAALQLKNLEIEAYARAAGAEDAELRKLRAEAEALQASIRALAAGQTAGGVVLPPEDKLPGLLERYRRLQAEAELQTGIYQGLAQQQEAARVQAQGALPAFQVYSRAEAPVRQAGPDRGKLCRNVAAASLFLGIALAFLVDYLARAMRDPANRSRMRGRIEEE
jgi:hypothetical protein